MKKTERSRLSIDLDAYPDIRDMLNDAMGATGDSATKLTIAALRARLPEVVLQLQKQRAKATEAFAKRYVESDQSDDDTVNSTKRGEEAAFYDVNIALDAGKAAASAFNDSMADVELMEQIISATPAEQLGAMVKEGRLIVGGIRAVPEMPSPVKPEPKPNYRPKKARANSAASEARRAAREVVQVEADAIRDEQSRQRAEPSKPVAPLDPAHPQSDPKPH